MKNNHVAVFVLIFVFVSNLAITPALAESSTTPGKLNKINILKEQIQKLKATTSPKIQRQWNAEEHRSPVANFVQSLIDMANRENDSIGEQIRIIAREQDQSEATTTAAIDKIENRGKIKTFLFGSDFKNLGALRSQMVQTRNRLARLTDLIKTETASTTAELQGKIKALEQEQLKIENFVKAQDGKVGLFGWLTRLFNK